jgi:hypothetical protein
MMTHLSVELFILPQEVHTQLCQSDEIFKLFGGGNHHFTNHFIYRESVEFQYFLQRVSRDSIFNTYSCKRSSDVGKAHFNNFDVLPPWIISGDQKLFKNNKFPNSHSKPEDISTIF